MAIERGHLSVVTSWMFWSDTPVRGRTSTLPNPYFYFRFCFLLSPKHTHTHYSNNHSVDRWWEFHCVLPHDDIVFKWRT